VIVVSNTSPITNLAAVGQLSLLQQLYENIVIPQAVYDEMAGLGYTVPGTVEVQTLSWIQIQQVRNLTLVTELQRELDKGEAEAIVLAVELGADALLMDERRGRRIASRFGLNVIGLLGVLLEAKHSGLIPAVKPVMDVLIERIGFRISNQLYSDILHSAGE
jgi:predicted nucleic acid-binding protein